MPTISPRINIVTNTELYNSIRHIAKAEDISLSAVAKELIMEALDKREDRFLSDISNTRDNEGAKTISHKKIWNV